MVIQDCDNIGIIWLNTTMGLVNPPEWKMLHKIWNLIFDIVMRYIGDKPCMVSLAIFIPGQSCAE
jgi:hypothetical protein